MKNAIIKNILRGFNMLKINFYDAHYWKIANTLQCKDIAGSIYKNIHPVRKVK